jgi:hypothetical protein
MKTERYAIVGSGKNFRTLMTISEGKTKQELLEYYTSIPESLALLEITEIEFISLD